MRLHILSDLHLEFRYYVPEELRADAVILAGDIHVRRGAVDWIKRHFPKQPVLCVAGNHEFYGSSIKGLLRELRDATDGSNIAFLENDSIEIGGFTFLGCTLWSDFKVWPNPQAAMLAASKGIRDFNVIRSARDWFRPEEAAELHAASLNWLTAELAKNDPRKTVIITHHAPSEKSASTQHAGDILNGAFLSPLDAFVKQSGVPLWIHGHTHHCVDYRLGATRVFSNQLGYPGHVNPNFKPHAVIEL